MADLKRVVVTVVLLAVIVGAVVYVVKRLRPKMPSWVLDTPVEKIDCKTFELITRTYGEWKKLGQKDGRYKNPNSGAYTMVEPTRCDSCGEVIPMPHFPEPVEGQDVTAMREEILWNYKCPRCGEYATREDIPPP